MLCSVVDWVNIQQLLSNTIGKAAKVALGNDPSKVQKYIMSGNQTHRKILWSKVALLCPFADVDQSIILCSCSPESEREITAGLFQLKADPNHCCLWSKRTFSDLLEQKPSDPALSLFCDLVVGQRGLGFDIEALKSLNHLKEARMPAKYIGYVRRLLDQHYIYSYKCTYNDFCAQFLTVYGTG